MFIPCLMTKSPLTREGSGLKEGEAIESFYPESIIYSFSLFESSEPLGAYRAASAVPIDLPEGSFYC